MRKIAFYCLLPIMVASCGCSVEPETLDSLRAAVETISNENSSPSRNADGLLEEHEVIEATFQPPHRDRKDAFAFADGIDVDNEGNTEASVTNVAVMGFSNVRELQVFLRIDDRIRSLRVGEAFRGIKVVAIREPVVELRMGSLVWTATMFDKTRDLR